MNPFDRTYRIPALPKQAGKTNVPGLRRLWLIEARHVLGLTDPRTVPGFIGNNWLLTPTALQLSEDAVVHALRVPGNTSDYEQKSAVSVQGVLYQQVITLAVPRDHPTTSLMMQRMAGRRWLAIYQDGNGQLKLVGTPKQPLRFFASQKTSPNGYVFSWSADTKQPSYFFNDTGLLFTTSDTDYSTEFSYGFDYDFFS